MRSRFRAESTRSLLTEMRASACKMCASSLLLIHCEGYQLVSILQTLEQAKNIYKHAIIFYTSLLKKFECNTDEISDAKNQGCTPLQLIGSPSILTS